MTRSELELAIDWAAAEGWNPGLQDAHCFYAADPNGFLLGLLEGEPIAAISCVKYSDGFGFLGLYIVHPAFRAQGYGLQMWRAGLAHLSGCTVGLDGVLAQQSNYAKSGFTLAHRNIRYEGKGDSSLSKDSPEIRQTQDNGLVSLERLPLERIVDYDRLFFPAPRADFLSCWITQPNSHAIGILQDQSLAGYGVLRACRQGYKIGPLFAEGAAEAEAIFLSLKAKVPPNSPFYLDIPEVNPQAIALAANCGLSPVFETARMYNQQTPALPLEKIFGITSFELG